MALFATIAAVLGTDVKGSAIYMIFCFSACSLVMGLGWIFFRSGKLSAKRTLPDYGSVGQELQYTVEVDNELARPLSAMTFEEWPPDPTPDYETFANTPEPGEDKRNIVDRTMLFYRWTWLQERERGFNILEASQSPRKITQGKSERVTFNLTPQHRGLLQLAELRVLLPDPFGLFQRCQRVSTSKDHIIILPKRYPLGQLSLAGNAHLQLGGETSSNSIGQTGDFLHLRDYQSGDAMRSVDWKSWARTGTPVVREFEESFFPRYGVLLDTASIPGQPFEEAVSVASSFLTSLDTQDCLLDLMFIGEKSYRLTDGQETTQRNKLLEILATAQARKNTDYHRLQTLISQQSDGLTALLLIFPSWSKEKEAFLTELQSRGVQATAFVIVDESSEQAHYNRPLPNVHYLRLQQIAHDLTLATSRLSV